MSKQPYDLWQPPPNARLRAAAKDLLLALKGLYQHTKNEYGIAGLNEAAKAAINKAEDCER